MEQRFLKRRRSKKVSRILSQVPGTGKEIENFVKDCGAGADAWCRTGVITFDGNRKVKKKPTFKHVKEHLEEKLQFHLITHIAGSHEIALCLCEISALLFGDAL